MFAEPYLLAFVALASLVGQASAARKPLPYTPHLKRMTVPRLNRRDDAYVPIQSICQDGLTCSEACGSGYESCGNNETTIHCYNPVDLKQICCSDGNGNSCDPGFYCALDSAGHTLCCPEGLSEAQCANTFKATGSLSSEAPLATPPPPVLPTPLEPNGTPQGPMTTPASLPAPEPTEPPNYDDTETATNIFTLVTCPHPATPTAPPPARPPLPTLNNTRPPFNVTPTAQRPTYLTAGGLSLMPFLPGLALAGLVGICFSLL